MTWQFWGGERINTRPYIAFDTETEASGDLSRETPQLAVLQVSNGREVWLVHPDDVERFIVAHAGAIWVGFNVAFDWPVIDAHIDGMIATDAWRAALDEGRVKDLMLFDFLAQLADPEGAATHLRGLGDVAKAYLGRTDVDKESPYRLRFGELIGLNLEQWRDDVDPGFWEYAAKDAQVTWEAWQRARARHIARASRPLPPMSSVVHGLQTEDLQVRASVVLREIGRRGFALDASRVSEVKARLLAQLEEDWRDLEAEAPGLFKRYVRTGELRRSKTGAPMFCHDVLRAKLTEVADRLGVDTESLPKTPKTGLLTTALDPWREAAGEDEWVVKWAAANDNAKLHQFLCQLAGRDVIHADYRPLVRTGRTSCTKPNVQQMPRAAWLRELFVARPGHKLVIVDYSAIELVTLGAVLLNRYGKSVLADQLRAGRDPHSYTASLVERIPYEEFLAGLKAEKRLAPDDPAPRPFTKVRQSAKAINFGVPGGLGAAKLSAYAKANYGVAMDEDEAYRLRHALTTEVYPELEQYLADDVLERLRQNLGVTEEQVWEARSDIPQSSWAGVAYHLDSIVSSGKTRQGKWLAPITRSYAWGFLNLLTRGTDLNPRIRECRASFRLWRRLLGGTATTLTGRTRAGLSYTEARNTPFQGLAADGAKVALYDLWRVGKPIVAFIHDEIVGEVPDEEAEEEKAAIERIMIDAMSSVLQCDIPVQVEGRISDRWTK